MHNRKRVSLNGEGGAMHNYRIFRSHVRNDDETRTRIVHVNTILHFFREINDNGV